MSKCLTAAGATDRGERAVNEDAILLRCEPSESAVKSVIAAVADGMGGLPNGDIASKVAIEALARVMLDAEVPKQKRSETAFAAAHRAVRDFSANRVGGRRMGTTLLSCVATVDSISVAHVGDCRAYLLTGSDLRQMTTDHTVVEEQVAARILTPTEALESPFRHVLTRAIGSLDEPSKPEVLSMGLREVEAVLLCSDGLHGYLPVERIEAILRASAPAEAVLQLISDTRSVGAPDNLSAIVIRATEC